MDDTSAEVVAATEEAPDLGGGATEPVDTPAPVPSPRESAEAAFEQLAKKTEGKETPAKKEPVVTKKPALKVPVAAHTRTIAKPTPAAVQATEAKPAEGAAEQIKPPANWTAQEREHWAKIPAEGQKAILRAERAAAILIQKTKEEAKKTVESAEPARKFVGMFAEAVRPFAHVIQAEGSNPVQAFTEYLKTATVLRQGSPQAKANMLAGYIHQFSVPIEPLAAAIEALQKGGALPEAGQGAPQRPQQLDPEAIIAEAHKRWEAKQAEREQATRLATTGESVQEFGSKKEFFNDVRQDMADILELHAARMKRLPQEERFALELDDVYDRACRNNPDVSKIYLQRKAAEEVAQREPKLEATRRAASSIRSRPAGFVNGRAKTSSNDPRAATEAAWEQLTGGA